MKKLKAFKIVYFVTVLIITVLVIVICEKPIVYANETNVNGNVSTVESKDKNKDANSFKGKKITSYGYLYNLDGSADYIGVEFENGGYAVFLRDSLEMMECSLDGDYPFENFADKKYYAGPANYLKKSGNSFENVVTGEIADVSSLQAVKFSRQTRSLLNKNSCEKTLSQSDLSEGDLKKDISNINSLLGLNFSELSSAPEIDTENLICASKLDGKYISNANYFWAQPMRGNNYTGGIYGNGNSGTCGPIAAQLLLGFNNYYNYRRIIPDRFLNGYDDATNAVKYPEKNPNYCKNPAKMTSETTGTRSEGTGVNSFYNEMITRIMPPNTSSSFIGAVKDGIYSYLKENFRSTLFSVNYEWYTGLFGANEMPSSKVKEEIDADRPLIIYLSSALGGTNHFVVGYGYQEYQYPDDPIYTYMGYVVHFGWGGNRNCIWVNSSWCNGYVSLKMNHEHSYELKGQIDESGVWESKCSVCGHRTDAYIKIDANSRYTERLAQWDYYYKDFYIEFEEDSYQLFQTFGDCDTKLSLYDSNGNLVQTDDNSGYNNNAFISQTVSPNGIYRLRVERVGKYIGETKLAITPSDSTVDSYDAIRNITTTSYGWIVHWKRVKLLCFTPSSSGTYRFTMFTNTESDTYLYFIDPTVISECICDDDSGGDYQAMIETELVAGRRYLLIGSTIDITYEREDEGTEWIGITVSKIS